MTEPTILWRRIDRPGHESARIVSADSHFQLIGTAVFAHDRQPCLLEYQIVCDAMWKTLSATVSGWVGEESIEVNIAVDSEHLWLLNDKGCPEVSGCVDLDLNFSPSTNLLPIRRLNLALGAESVVRAAWLRFPSFKLEPLEQLYRRVETHLYRYESAGGTFVADLQVNEAGFVTVYPNVWQIEK